MPEETFFDTVQSKAVEPVFADALMPSPYGLVPASYAGNVGASTVVPTSTYSYISQGCILCFYKGVPKNVMPALKAELLAKGLAT